MNFGMGYRIKLFVLAASAAIAIAGCQETADGPVIKDKVPPARQNISINELAAALGLRVSESKRFLRWAEERFMSIQNRSAK